jgi:DNA-binding MarR family transcriptional regulator
MDITKDPVIAALDGLRVIVRALRASAYSAERGLGVSGAQLFVLRELESEPGISLAQLAEKTMTDPSSVSVVVARLVETGLVLRKRDPDDARRAQLTLSPRGRTLLKKAPEPVQRRLISALQAMPKKRVRRLAEMLSELSVALGIDQAETPQMFFEEEPPRPRRRPAAQKNR